MPFINWVLKVLIILSSLLKISLFVGKLVNNKKKKKQKKNINSCRQKLNIAPRYGFGGVYNKSFSFTFQCFWR